MSEQHLETALKLVMQDANRRGLDAGYSGEMGDRGASRLRELVEVYRHGLNRTIPKFLKPYLEEATRVVDPEYAEYQRLKKKFNEGGVK